MVQDYQQQKIIDNRKAKDKNLIDQEYERILNYLQDTNMEDAPSRLKLQNGLSLKDYVTVLNHLLQIIGLDPIKLDYEKAEFTKKVGEGIVNIQETLGYPEKNRLKQTDMASISSSNSPKALLFLTWLVELTEFSTIMTADIGQLNNDTTQEQFIASIYTTDDPEKLLEGSEYNTVLHTLYKEFLDRNGEDEQAKETMFGVMEEELKSRTKILLSKENQCKMDLNMQQTYYQTTKDREQNLYNQQLQQYSQYFDEGQIQNMLQTESQSTLNQELSPQDLLNFYQSYKEKFQNILNMLQEQTNQNQNRLLPDLRDIIKINQEKLSQLQHQQQQIDQDMKQIQEQQQKQSATYQDYVRAEYENKNLSDENQALELQIAETNKKLEQSQQFIMKNEEDINKIVDQLNTLQIQANGKEDIKQLAKQQAMIKKQQTDIETQSKSLQITLSKLESQDQDLQHILDEIDKSIQEQVTTINSLQVQIEQQYNEMKQQDEFYTKSLERVQQEFAQCKQQLIVTQNQIQEIKQQNIQLTAEFNQQEKRLEGEQKKLVDVVTQIYQLIAEARKQCRNNLEMLRHRLATAKDQLQEWKQMNQL